MVEKKLWAAVLGQAIHDLEKNNNGEYPPDKWFTSDYDEPGSFLWICELFEIDPEKTKTAISRRIKNGMDKC